MDIEYLLKQFKKYSTWLKSNMDIIELQKEVTHDQRQLLLQKTQSVHKCMQAYLENFARIKAQNSRIETLKREIAEIVGKEKQEIEEQESKQQKLDDVLKQIEIMAENINTNNQISSNHILKTQSSISETIGQINQMNYPVPLFKQISESQMKYKYDKYCDKLNKPIVIIMNKQNIIKESEKELVMNQICEFKFSTRQQNAQISYSLDKVWPSSIDGIKIPFLNCQNVNNQQIFTSQIITINKSVELKAVCFGKNVQESDLMTLVVKVDFSQQNEKIETRGMVRPSISMGVENLSVGEETPNNSYFTPNPYFQTPLATPSNFQDTPYNNY